MQALEKSIAAVNLRSACCSGATARAHAYRVKSPTGVWRDIHTWTFGRFDRLS
jgi:hypothetical protein